MKSIGLIGVGLAEYWMSVALDLIYFSYTKRESKFDIIKCFLCHEGVVIAGNLKQRQRWRNFGCLI